MMKATVLGPVAALVIGGAAGFFAGKNAAPEVEANDGVPADVRSSRRSTSSFSSGSGSASNTSAREWSGEKLGGRHGSVWAKFQA